MTNECNPGFTFGFCDKEKDVNGKNAEIQIPCVRGEQHSPNPVS